MGKNQKHSLKNTLHLQQSRMQQKQKAAHFAEQKAKKGMGKKSQKASASTLRPTIPFTTHDRILLIGEGNFSFTRALIFHPPGGIEGISPKNVTATAYDTEEECYEKYTDAEGIVAQLRERGVAVVFGVDATQLEKNPLLKGSKWTKVVWNFPHAGKGITDQDRNILANQTLILGFLRSASSMLMTGAVPVIHSARKKNTAEDDDDESEDEEMTEPKPSQSRGTVLITLRNHIPYTQWDVPRLAKNPPKAIGTTKPTPPYDILRSFAFHRSLWQGYEHRMTKGERAHGTGKTGQGGEDRTWEFYVRDIV